MPSIINTRYTQCNFFILLTNSSSLFTTLLSPYIHSTINSYRGPERRSEAAAASQRRQRRSGHSAAAAAAATAAGGCRGDARPGDRLALEPTRPRRRLGQRYQSGAPSAAAGQLVQGGQCPTAC